MRGTPVGRKGVEQLLEVSPIHKKSGFLVALCRLPEKIPRTGGCGEAVTAIARDVLLSQCLPSA
jgi:hypothetical protein